MQTDKWGPSAWTYLHTVTFNYPISPTPEDKINYKILFDNFGKTMPCKFCRDSYNTFYQILLIDNFLDDRHGLTYWLFCIHNLVNIKLNKPVINFEQVVYRYENKRARCTGHTDLNDCKKKLPFNKDMNTFCNIAFTKYKSLIKKLLYNIEKFSHKNEIVTIINNCTY